MFYAVIYQYVDNIEELRQPHRADHLSLIQVYVDNGSLLLAGALTEPLDGGLLIFKGDDEVAARQFVQDDPYVINGLVCHWQVRPWNVVAGSLL